jgi:putative SOS response-associated peptidase YedK
MIDRYSLAVTAAEVAAALGVDPFGFGRPVFNAFPASLLPVVTQNSKGLSHFYWGATPQWAKNKSIAERLINVRMETIQERASTRKALMRARCVAPADGFYVWKRISKKSMVPHRVMLKSKGVFAMAGFWEEFENETGETLHTFKIITCPPNAAVFALHDRMPAMLGAEQQATWLHPHSTEQQLLDALRPFPSEEMDSYAVSPRIQHNQPFDSTLINPVHPTDQHGNLTLFG